MEAVVTTGDGTVALRTAQVPIPAGRQVLVRVMAAAQNPTQWMTLDALTSSDIVVGTDFAGVVAELGPDVSSDLPKTGDRVAGFILGGVTKELGGTFAEYCLADAELLISVPESMSFEEAAGLGLCGFTACQTLWQNQKLPTPSHPAHISQHILVWSGATSVGQFVIQLATLSGLHVVTTASPQNAPLLLSLGAKEVFDYHDSDVCSRIQANYTIKSAVDCISSDDSIASVCKCLPKTGGYVALVLPVDSPRANVKAELTVVYTLLGMDMDWPFKITARPEHHALGATYARLLSELLAKKQLKPTPAKVVPNGLTDVQYWIDYQRAGKVKAEKIIYQVAVSEL